MEYNDSKNKTEMYEFYFHKLNKMLRNPEVIDVLDKHGPNDNSEVPTFKEELYKISYHSPKIENYSRRRSTSWIDHDFGSDEHLDKKIVRQKTISSFKKKKVY